jgi:hypothetical protein
VRLLTEGSNSDSRRTGYNCDFLSDSPQNGDAVSRKFRVKNEGGLDNAGPLLLTCSRQV